MAFVLDGTTLKRPNSMDVSNSTQYAQQRTLSGDINRDYFGSNKRVWVLQYVNTQKAYFDTIDAIYQSYLSTTATKTWVITETNYSVSSTNVHVNLEERGFSIKGDSYLSDFTLTLVEA